MELPFSGRRYLTGGGRITAAHPPFFLDADPPPLPPQISTTKGTGGDIIILEEAAYIDPGFFYETVAPLLIMGNTTLLAISTLTSEINFYTRLMKMRDKVTHQPIFTFLSVELACAACKAEGKASECVHMLHLVPRWQSADRHVKLKTIMQDRPDLIESELSGLAFDSLQQIFKPHLLDLMFSQPCPPPVINEDVHLFIDPAAGGPFSDYAILSITRQKGLVTVSARVARPQQPQGPVPPLGEGLGPQAAPHGGVEEDREHLARAGAGGLNRAATRTPGRPPARGRRSRRW